MPLPALFILAYFIGSVPFGLIIGKVFFKTDLREHGSRNIGATNAYRVLGWKGGLPVFALDLAKGIGPVVTATMMSKSSLLGYPHGLVIVGAGFAAVMGHTASPFLKFKGGKGVATSLGVAIGLSWLGGLLAFASWILVLAVTRYVSVASIIGTAVGAALIYLLNGSNVYYGVFGLFATLYVFYKHIPNVKRLMRREEPPVRMPWDKKPDAEPHKDGTQ